jgi:putative tricarboxylic transport membrane protein
VTGSQRFTFGYVRLAQGIDLVPVIMGLYGVAEVLVIVQQGIQKVQVTSVRLRDLLPTWLEAKLSAWPIVRGSVIGFLVGLIPGPATVMSTFISYAFERRISRAPERFGHGAIEGVAGPESANNAATAGAMVPLLSLGIPFAPATAMLLSALVLHGIRPGPLLMVERPEVFWGVVASMYIGNFILLILNLPLVRIFVSILQLPQHILAAVVLLLCLVGAYSLNNSLLDLWVLAVMGAVGYWFRRIGVDPAPLVVALVLGPLLEKTLRQALFMANGDWTYLLFRPLTAGLLLTVVLVLASSTIFRLTRRGRPATNTFREEIP